MRLVIIGTGNTATVLGRAFRQAGHTIVQVYGRDPAKAASLAALLESTPVSDLSQVTSKATCYFLAVSDDAVATVAAALHLPDKFLIHTAGSVSIDVLKPASSRVGVLYPVQSLKADMERIPDIPLLVDAGGMTDLAFLADLASSISSKVSAGNDEQRLHLHVAAVMVSNFTNHLYALAEQFCKKENTDFSMLLPLISEVASRLQHSSPQTVQTGPAIRNDMQTINRHLGLLDDYPQLRELYSIFTESIQKMYGKQEMKQ